MTIQLKSTLVVLATLFLGVVVGVLGNHWLMRPRFKSQEFRKPEGFVQFNEQLIHPTESQSDTIRAILFKYHAKFNTLNEQHRGALTAVLDSMQAELTPLLTKEQLERLQQRRRMAPPQGMDRPRPGAPGPPGRGPKPGFPEPPGDRPGPDFSRPDDFPPPPPPDGPASSPNGP